MKRTKSGKILIRVGPDSAKRLARNEAIAKKQRERADQRAAKKAATALRRSQRAIAKRAMMIARKMAKDRIQKRERDKRQQENNSPPKRKRPWHPKGPNATAKYTSYARRLERSKKLTATRIDADTYTCNGYTISAKENKPLSCTCPDFTQAAGGRNWQGSNAGPFICKHILAVKPCTQYITVIRSGTGADDGSTEGKTDPTDHIPQPWEGFAPYTSSIVAGSTQGWGGSRWNVFNSKNKLVYTTGGYYTNYVFVDAGIICT